MTELLGLPFSPWTEKARFALDARRVPYRFRHYQPLLGEPSLRVKLRRPLGRVTVPVLTVDDGHVLSDSADIARWADGQGDGPRLFPPEHEAAIARFIALSERALAAGRALELRRVHTDDEALREMVPGSLRRRLGPLAPRIAALGITRTLHKYGAHHDGPEVHRRTLASALADLRAALAEAPPGEPRTIFGHLTFADIAMAQALAFVEPPATGLRLGPASRRAFVDPELSASHADLVAWRDALYAAYRNAAR